MLKVIGIDPGLAITGYGLIGVKSPDDIKLIEAGVIRTKVRQHISGRVLKIFRCLNDVINEFKPQVLVLEKLYSHYRHPTTSILMAHARGTICLLCGLNNIKLVSYPSTRIKKAITGAGHASKVQIQRMVSEVFHLKKIPEPVDITDALALALSFVYIELRGK